MEQLMVAILVVQVRENQISLNVARRNVQMDRVMVTLQLVQVLLEVENQISMNVSKRNFNVQMDRVAATVLVVQVLLEVENQISI